MVVERAAGLRSCPCVPPHRVRPEVGELRRQERPPDLQRAAPRAAVLRPEQRVDSFSLDEPGEREGEHGGGDPDPCGVPAPEHERGHCQRDAERTADNERPGSRRDLDQGELPRDPRAPLRVAAAPAGRAAEDESLLHERRERDNGPGRRDDGDEDNGRDPVERRAHGRNIGRVAVRSVAGYPVRRKHTRPAERRLLCA